jgi:hypothetical protein
MRHSLFIAETACNSWFNFIKSISASEYNLSLRTSRSIKNIDLGLLADVLLVALLYSFTGICNCCQETFGHVSCHTQRAQNSVRFILYIGRRMKTDGASCHTSLNFWKTRN